ncbi:MAG: hypothetical protein IJ693_06605 [Bacteroidaceae bacterium]|nr:hypothetical protein [Bacteroidaceae bacterium]
MCLFACDGDDNGGVEEPKPQTYTQSVTMQAIADDKVVVLEKLNAPIVEMTSYATWLQVEQEPYTSGSPSVRLIVEANPNTSEREARVIVTTYSKDRLDLTVIQDAKGETPSEEEDYTIENTHDAVTDQSAYAPIR